MKPRSSLPQMNQRRRDLYQHFLDRFERAMRVRDARAARDAAAVRPAHASEKRKSTRFSAPAHERRHARRPARPEDDRTAA